MKLLAKHWKINEEPTFVKKKLCRAESRVPGNKKNTVWTNKKETVFSWKRIFFSSTVTEIIYSQTFRQLHTLKHTDTHCWTRTHFYTVKHSTHSVTHNPSRSQHYHYNQAFPPIYIEISQTHINGIVFHNYTVLKKEASLNLL